MSKESPQSTLTSLVANSLVKVLDALSAISVGDRMPSEVSLSEQSAVSRTTVREVVGFLEREGIIHRDGRVRTLARGIRAKDYPGKIPEGVPKGREVVHYLLEAVGKGRIRPGQRFSERTISQALGCSRSPVREALISLAPLGLFRKDDRRQWEAVELDARQVEELIEMRVLVEGFGLKCLMKPKVLKRNRSRLERLLERTRKMGEVPRFDMGQFSTLDVEFHHIILEAPANRIFLEHNEFMSALVEFQLHNEHFSGERARLGLQQHIEIIEAILNADAKNAQRLLFRHLQTAEETLKGFCAG